MARKHTGIRLSEDAYERLDELATKHGVFRSDVIRACLAVALRHRDELGTILKNMKEIR